MEVGAYQVSDSARWCERCHKFGDHHTDRHPQPLLPIADDLDDPAFCAEHRGWTDAIKLAQQALYDIDEMHKAVTDPKWDRTYCNECDLVWPCPTARKLHPELSVRFP